MDKNINKERCRETVSGIRRIHRITRRLSRLPQSRLSVDMDIALDVDYITEWLDIILCRICGQRAIEAPPLPENAAPLQIYCHCMKKSARQAGRIRWGLFTRKIDRNLLTQEAWGGIDSVENMLRSSSMGAVQPRGWHE